MSIGGGLAEVLGVFGENLDRLMKAKRVENADLGGAVDVSDVTVSRWRNGHQGPDIPTLDRIANYLKVPAYLLLLPDYDEEQALIALKTARQGLGAGGGGGLLPLLRMLVSSVAWSIVERWEVPGNEASRGAVRRAEATERVADQGVRDVAQADRKPDAGAAEPQKRKRG